MSKFLSRLKTTAKNSSMSTLRRKARLCSAWSICTALIRALSLSAWPRPSLFPLERNAPMSSNKSGMVEINFSIFTIVDLNSWKRIRMINYTQKEDINWACAYGLVGRSVDQSLYVSAFLLVQLFRIPTFQTLNFPNVFIQ